MHKHTTTSATILLKPLTVIVTVLMLAAMVDARAERSSNGVSVSMPNGFVNVAVNDLKLPSAGGKVRWQRWWDGHHWKFNNFWESLSQTWANATCSRVPQANGSWQWLTVDSTDSLATPSPVHALTTQPFNQVMSDATSDYPLLGVVDVNIAGGCLAASVGTGNLEGIRRQSELYVGKDGHFVYNNSSILEQRPVKSLPVAASASLDAQLATGTVTINPVDIPKGFRWTHREGRWMEYNLRGQVVAYGDNNNNITWLARDSNGILRGVVDGTGHVLLALHYTGGLLTGVSDFPMPGNSLDLPARSVNYQYNANNRLSQVTDVRGFATQYGYDAQGRISTVTDPEGHSEQFFYDGNLITRRIAADGGVTDYAFGFDQC